MVDLGQNRPLYIDIRAKTCATEGNEVSGGGKRGQAGGNQMIGVAEPIRATSSTHLFESLWSPSHGCSVAPPEWDIK